MACAKGNLNIVDYLLYSSEIEHNADIHAMDDDAFKKACNQSNFDVISHLIFNCNIEKTEQISGYLHVFNDDFTQKVKNMFELRDLNKDLGNNLKDNPTHKKPHKI